jgi:hypothetical protein
MNHQTAAPHLVHFIETWAEKSRVDVLKDGYASLSQMLDINKNNNPYKEMPKAKFMKLLSHRLERQIVLVKYLSFCFLLDSQGLDDTKRFVSLQQYDRIPSISDPCYMLSFKAWRDGKVILMAKDFKDVFFADLYALMLTHGVTVTHPDPDWITKEKKNYLVQCLRENMKYDGFKISLRPAPIFGIKEETGPINNNPALCVTYQCDGIPTTDNEIRIVHASKLFNINIPKWLAPPPVAD